jgi:hypothetical protein
MTSYIAIAAFIIGGLALARWMQLRDANRIRPVLERVARLRNGEVIRQSVIGLPQLSLVVGGVPMRLTPMSTSSASNEAGMMTSVDFDVGKFGVAEFRSREAMASLRNAVPPTLAGGNRRFELGHARFDERFRISAMDVDQAAAIAGDSPLLQAILGLPAGADICVQKGTAFISVSGVPTEIDFVDRLLAVAERLIAVLQRLEPVSGVWPKRQAAQTRFPSKAP